MKSSNKKKKKRGVKKSNRSPVVTKPLSKEDSSPVPIAKEEKRKAHQLVPKKTIERKPENRNKIAEYTGIAVQFLRDARTELKKVK